MNWLLDLVDDYRAAVKYDLLKHGYRLEWLGTEWLPWGDAVALVALQPPGESAVYRMLEPDLYDRDRKVELLEMLAVLLVQNQILNGNQTGLETNQLDLPKTYQDLFESPVDSADKKPELELLTFEEIDRKMGWAN